MGCPLAGGDVSAEMDPWPGGQLAAAQEATPEGGHRGRAGDSAWLRWVLPVGVHSEAPACGPGRSCQLHVHHVHVLEAEIRHKHPDHVVKAEAGCSQGSGCHGVGVSGGKGAELTDRAFVEHSTRPSAAGSNQGPLQPEAIWVCGHGDS